MLAALLPPIGIPFYFFRLHSPLRAAIATLLAASFFVFLLFVFALASNVAKLAAP